MLKKLMKYDLETIYKGVIVFYILSIFFAILTRIFFGIENSFIMNIIAKVCSGVTIAMIFNILINNMMRLWGRFRQNLYGDESYLTHTLPIKKRTIYLSKFLTTLVSLFTSVLIIVLSLFIAYYSKENIELLKNILLPLAKIYNSTAITIILSFIFVIFLEIMNMQQSGFLGIVLGHRKNNNKIVYSIVFGFLAYLATQVFIIIVLFITGFFNKDIMNLFYTVDALNIDTIKLCIYLAIMVYTLNIIILYFITSKVFKKGVNID